VAHIKCRKSNTETYTNICSWEKIRRIYRILALTKNQADLQNPCAYKKSGGFTESLRLQKIRRAIESLRALKSLRLAKNQRDWKNRRPAYCLGSAESPATDFEEMAKIHAATKN
jgi:hypothetical protein